MRRFCIAVTDHTYVEIPDEDLAGLTDEEACELAEEKFNNGEYSDVSCDSCCEVTEV